MKKTFLLLFVLMFTMSACSQTEQNTEVPAATKANGTTEYTERPPVTESSTLETERDEEYERYMEQRVNVIEEFASYSEFKASGFIEEYYSDFDLPYEYIAPKFDDTIKESGGVTAYYTTYYADFEYNGTPFTLTCDLNFTEYDEQAKENKRYASIKQLYDYFDGFTYDDMEFTLDESRDIIIRTSPKNSEGPCIIKLAPRGIIYDLFAKAGTDPEILIEAAEHIF